MDATGAPGDQTAQDGGPFTRRVPANQRNPVQIRAVVQRMEAIAAAQTLDADWKELRDAGRKV